MSQGTGLPGISAAPRAQRATLRFLEYVNEGGKVYALFDITGKETPGSLSSGIMKLPINSPADVATVNQLIMGYETHVPIGPRRIASFGYEGFTNATTQGTDNTVQLLNAIRLHQLTGSFSASILASGLPAASAEWSILFTIQSYTPEDAIDNGTAYTAAGAVGGATQFYAAATADPEFTGQVVVGNANSGGGAGTGNFAAATGTKDTLLAVILKGFVTTTGPVGGPFQVQALSLPEIVLPAKSFLTFHADEVTTAALTLNFEMQVQLTYTPIVAPTATRRTTGSSG